VTPERQFTVGAHAQTCTPRRSAPRARPCRDQGRNTLIYRTLGFFTDAGASHSGWTNAATGLIPLAAAEDRGTALSIGPGRRPNA